MSKSKLPVTIPHDEIKHINYDGITGRIVKVEAKGKSKKPLIVIGGQHTTHERMYAFALFLADYGTVYMIDVPGFGGMPNFSKVGKPINYDSYGDYLYAVLKTQKLTKDITVFAVSVGSSFVTRMLQMHPDSQKWFARYIAFVGFGAAKDFNITQPMKAIDTMIAASASTRLGALVMKSIFINPISLTVMLKFFGLFKGKMKSDDPAVRRNMYLMEKHMWRVNDIRTHAVTTLIMFTKDLRKGISEPITVPFHNITTKKDQYVDGKEVRKTFRDLFADYTEHLIELGVHMPSAIDGPEEVAKLFDQEMINEIMSATRNTK